MPPTVKTDRDTVPLARTVVAIPPNIGSIKSWTVSDATKLYRVNRWGQGYFAVNNDGHVAVQPNQNPVRQIDLKKLVDQLQLRDLNPPLLIRLTDILKHRIQSLHTAFHTATTRHNYRGGYRCVYPIKVNQQQHVVADIRRFSQPLGFGIEVGSKPELLAVMSLIDDETTPIICNGFKDKSYIEAVILAHKVGKHVIPVVEQYSELALIIRFAKQHGVRPPIGIRMKLATQGCGRWEASGGMRSKFGLFTTELLAAVEVLRKEDMLDCFNLLHGHLGSQIPDVGNLNRAVTELARTYVQLDKLGVGLHSIDVGGGLGVDYDGSKSDFESSVNYSLDDYANSVVMQISQVCDEMGVEHPQIINESGRAIVAYHSVLIFNVIDCDKSPSSDSPVEERNIETTSLPTPIQKLCHINGKLNSQNLRHCMDDAQVAWDETLRLFSCGDCSLANRSLAEKVFYKISRRTQEHLLQKQNPALDLTDLQATLARTYYANFSVFQSLPDNWAIGQLFPIMPIHRLNERPTCRGTLVDITCDSDGAIDRFIDQQRTKPVLELHDFQVRKDHGYYLGAFLIGAYQEILGDMHNLFGNTHAVHVSLDDNDQVQINKVIKGDTVSEVLHNVQYNADELMCSMQRCVDRALAANKITIEEGSLLIRLYKMGLEGYTYLN